MKKEKYRYLPHTADIAFVAYGKSVEDAIQNSAEALLNVMLDLKKVRGARGRKERVSINESAGSLDNLVWYTLQRILTRVDERKLNAYSFEVRKVVRGERFKLSGSLLYKKLEDGKDNFLLEVKAVTPQGLAFTKVKSGYEVRVLLDV